MRRLALTLLVFAFSPAVSVAQQTQATVVSDVGFKGSEAARYDATADLYLISNLGVRGSEGGNDGFISRVAPDGTVNALRWIAGGANDVTLNDPLGIYVKGDTVYVADTNVVRRFHRMTGIPLGETQVSGAVRLNDLVVAPDGTIYVTDSGSDSQPGAIYKITVSGNVTSFAKRDPALERPNGIAIMADGNIVYGGRGEKLSIRTPSGTLVRQISLPTGRFDGIVALKGGGLLVASQNGHSVYCVPPSGAAKVVAQDIPVPAAIGLDTRRKRVLIPQIAASSLTMVDLTEESSCAAD